MRPVAFVLKGYPRLSETFIAQEIKALEKRGLPIRIISLRHPTDIYRHPIHDEIQAPISYLPEYLHQEPGRVWNAWQKARLLGGYKEAYQTWRRDFARDRTRNRVRRFGQACVLAAELSPEIVQIHAHFLHTPASVSRYAAMMLSKPWSCSAHAKDIYTSPDWELSEKLSDCEWLVTCTRTNVEHLSAFAPHAETVSLVYHGLDLTRFQKPEKRDAGPDGSSPGNPVTLLSVGRAVEKKGYDGLLKALAALPKDLNWRFIHIGGGPLKADLQQQARDLGIGERIIWRGALPQDQVLSALSEAQIFILNSRIAHDGDRDGLPNVLMEAQSQQLACIATRVSAIAELIIDGKTGVLVEPRDTEKLTNAIEDLMTHPQKRLKLARAGERRVRTHFSLDTGIDDLETRFSNGTL